MPAGTVSVEIQTAENTELERRQATRLLLRLDVHFALAGGKPVPCMAGDYAPEERILRLDAQHPWNDLPRSMEGTLQLSPGNGSGQEVEVAASILRAEDRSLVIALVNPSQEALALLKASVVSPPLSENQVRARQAAFAPEFRRLLPELRATVVRAVAQLGTSFVKTADERLTEALRDARNNREQTLFNEAQARFSRRQAQIVRQSVETLARAIDILDDPLQPMAGADDENSTDLSLIELADFEEFLTVSQLSGAFEKQLTAILGPLNKRLSHLAGREVEMSTSPLGPRVMCEAFADAMKGLLNDNQVSDLVYQALRETLEDQLEDLYTRVNSLLADRGVLSVIEPEKLTVRKLPDRGGARPMPSGTEWAGGSDGEPDGYPGHYGGPPAAHGQQGMAPPMGSGSAPPTAWAMPPGYSSSMPLDQALLGATLAAESWAGQGPPLGQVLSLAQHQLALRRRLQDPETGHSAQAQPAYTPQELLDGLSQLQYALAEAPAADPLYVENIKRQLTEALKAQGGADKAIGQAESDGIEIVGTLFQSLLQDAEVGEFARGNLRRLQGLVHKAAIRDQALFSTKEHPLLKLLERVAQIEEDPGEGGASMRSRLQDVIGQVNRSYDQDPAVVEALLGKLDAEIEVQGEDFQRGLQATVKAAEEQQRLLRERRARAGEAPPAEPNFPPELERWVGRAKSLRAGARLLMNANTPAPYVATVAWIGDDFNPYVLVDAKGAKIAALTLQQVVMYLRRGLVKILREQQDTAIDRALFGVVNRLHRQVVEQATHDTLTNLYTRKAFLQVVDEQMPLPDHRNDEPEAALCEIALENLRDVNARFGHESGDHLIREISEELMANCDQRHTVLGRLGGGEWGLFWPRITLDKAQAEVEALLERLSGLTSPFAPGLQPVFVAGIAGVDPKNPLLDLLVDAAHEGCAQARNQGEARVVIAGGDERKRLQLEQLAAYVTKAITRDRLVLLYHEVKPLEQASEQTAARLIVGAEDRAGKLIPPLLFSQAVANTASSFDVDLWALRTALRWIADNDEESDRFGSFILPLSRGSLETDGIASIIINEFMNAPVPPSRICFSLDDRAAHANLPEAVELIGSLREFGCRFVLGEFAGAQGDHAYVRELAVDFIEIAAAFQPAQGPEQRDLVIARSVNDLAHFMGKRTIARVNATPGALDVLRKMKVDFVHDTAHAVRLRVNKDD
ncbi:MAG: hypothetical protein RL434_291 [Pseudomonadota bacterium]|jgi:diguanylate cyclase (GGDEF)-like protein